MEVVLGIVALIPPLVTYAPYLPSFNSISTFVSGWTPNSLITFGPDFFGASASNSSALSKFKSKTKKRGV